MYNIRVDSREVFDIVVNDYGYKTPLLISYKGETELKVFFRIEQEQFKWSIYVVKALRYYLMGLGLSATLTGNELQVHLKTIATSSGFYLNNYTNGFLTVFIPALNSYGITGEEIMVKIDQITQHYIEGRRLIC